MMQHVVVVSSLSRLLLLPLPLFCIPSDVAVTRQQHLQQQLCPPPPQSVLSSNESMYQHFQEQKYVWTY